ncbi:diaminopimelate epimerase [Chryseosolibacter indicus]|uniref:Diaminopimelate epimerase n=1 Tax=Chryseosolibacter indicus TaxID=2782351 RepID=A0ABS5VSK0_9BACT|nr:diaminopimelate epimerase [Chryseosolibacter indicus]MBT1704409.1 diaminopimelate epimerase [Chryseosolibacter indicus]
MKIHFYKYQATGNDFVIVDNRTAGYSFTKEQIERICQRKFGVGADGLMLIEKHPSLDFNLVYYNSDGSQSLCGNGSRAAVAMAASLGLLKGKTSFNAYDGRHDAELLSGDIVRLKMNSVKEIKKFGNDFFINTGSPHFIRFVSKIEEHPVYEEGRTIRYDEAFKPGGTNVNFVEVLADNTIYVRTYERGVENETLSCGTGVTAAALAASVLGYKSPVKIGTLGGELMVEFKISQSGHANNPLDPTNGHSDLFYDIFLIGPAKMVFEGNLEL